MTESDKKRNKSRKVAEPKIFPVPFSLGEIKENHSLTKLPKYSKEELMNQGFKYHSKGNISEAIKYYQNFINLDFIDYKVFSNYGNILKEIGKLEDAELYLRKAIKINPEYAIAHSNLGSILKEIGKLKEAEISTKKAIKLNPNLAKAHYNLGIILKNLGKLKEAQLSLLKTIQIIPNFAKANYNLGNISLDLDQFYESIDHYKKAIELNNKLSIAKSGLIKARGIICDWSDQERQSNWLKNIGIEGSSIYPLGLFCYQDNPTIHLKRAKKLYKEKYYTKSEKIEFPKNKKIHIGYFSSDFRDHPTMHLICSILKLHDKSRFKIYLYSFAPKEDKYTEIAKNLGCIFKDINELNDIESVELARKDQLDIAIDLMGYITNSRMRIFSYKVAPIQINYLGYPGSLGSDTINYIIADKVVIPDGYEKFYSEKIIRMPNCYQCNDNTKEICKEPISRQDFNLPEKGFIFTCFNANKKITPKEFDIWMRLLRKVKGSVLWLYKSNQYSVDNLMKEAENRNIDKNRLIFANRLPLNKHLARHSLGDLGLDTFNYNGHTTTSDALWAGLPVLTKIGESFSARVSASILHSAGLSELITYSEKEYEEKALEIANNKNELLKIKSKLADLKGNSSLFNSKLFTKDLENIFIELSKS